MLVRTYPMHELKYPFVWVIPFLTQDKFILGYPLLCQWQDRKGSCFLIPGCPMTNNDFQLSWDFLDYDK